MAQQLGVRGFLTGKGYKDEDITYDPNRSMVQLKGMDFGQFTPEADGSTYGDFNGLTNQFNNFKTQQRNTQLDGIVSKLVTKAEAPPTFQYKAPGPYTFDPASNPMYQAAQREAGRNVATAEGNIAAAQNKRGIMNSTITANLGNQAAQQAYGHVTDVVLPQIAQQDYVQWADGANRDMQVQQGNYGVQRDQNKDLASLVPLLTGMNQQDADNAYRDKSLSEQQKQNNYDAYLKSVGLTGNLGSGPKSDYSLLGGTDGQLSLPGQQYQSQEQQRGIDNTRADQQLSASLANMTSDNARAAAADARAAGNQTLGNLFDVWDRTGVAPAGIPGVEAGTPLAGKTVATKPQTAEDFAKGITAQPGVVTKDASGAEILNKDAAEDAILVTPLSDYEKYRLYVQFGIKDRWPADQIPSPPSGN